MFVRKFVANIKKIMATLHLNVLKRKNNFPQGKYPIFVSVIYKKKVRHRESAYL